MNMLPNLPPAEVDPRRQVFAETLGRTAGKGRLDGRRIIVVGAGQRLTEDEHPPIGNGRAIAVLFAREGARVACIDISREAVEETCKQITSEGGVAHAVVGDVSDAASIPSLTRKCVQALGALDGLVLNVGISKALPLQNQTPDAWDYEFAVNVRSHMLFSQAALEIMEPGSSIVLMSSLASQRASSGNPAYESSKAAQVALARSIARAGEAKGIRCNSVLPGYMDTPMGRDASRRRASRATSVPFGRQGTGWEVALSCLFLMSHEASYVNAHALAVDGGLGVGIGNS